MTAPPQPTSATYRLIAPNIPESAKVARDMVGALLDVTGHLGLVDSARLLVSEVVSNVHLHTTVPQLQLATTVTGDHVLVSVQDEAPHGRPVAGKPPSDHALHGRGLLLVQHCASAWGTTWHGGVEPAAKRVWFELRDGSP